MDACNYDADAEANDGSCADPGDACDDGDSGTMNDIYDANCGCEGEIIVAGCTEASACNYDASANVDDGSCASLDECGVCGGDGIAEDACDCQLSSMTNPTCTVQDWKIKRDKKTAT